jgi:hypothetical protein
VSKQVTNLLQTFVNRCLQRIPKIYWPAVILNQQLWQTTQQEPTELEIKRCKWKWLGHTHFEGQKLTLIMPPLSGTQRVPEEKAAQPTPGDGQF